MARDITTGGLERLFDPGACCCNHFGIDAQFTTIGHG